MMKNLYFFNLQFLHIRKFCEMLIVAMLMLSFGCEMPSDYRTNLDSNYNIRKNSDQSSSRYPESKLVSPTLSEPSIPEAQGDKVDSNDGSWWKRLKKTKKEKNSRSWWNKW